MLVLVCSCLQLATTSAFQSGLPAHNVGHQNNPSWNKIPRSASTGEKIGSFRNSEIGYRRQVTRIAAATTDDDSGKGERRAALLGTLVLLTVPLSWGTYVPVGEWKCFSMQNFVSKKTIYLTPLTAFTMFCTLFESAVLV